MRNRIVKHMMFATLYLVLSACGGGTKINALNADTLRASITEIAKDMSEEERRVFAEDMYVIWNHRNDDAYAQSLSEKNRSNVSSRLYAPNHESFFRTGIGASYKSNWSKMAAEFGEKVNGKSASKIHSEAQAIRKKVLTALRDKVVKSAKEFEIIEKVLRSRREQLFKEVDDGKEAISTALANLPDAFEKALNDVTYTEQTGSLAEGFVAGTYHFSGTARFINTFGQLSDTGENGICGISMVTDIEMRFGNPPGTGARFDTTLPNESREFSFKLRTSKRSVARQLRSGDVAFSLRSAKECNYGQTLTRNRKNYFKSRKREYSIKENKAESCGKLANEVEERAKGFSDVIEKLSDLAEQPTSFDFSIPSMQVKTKYCLSS